MWGDPAGIFLGVAGGGRADIGEGGVGEEEGKLPEWNYFPGTEMRSPEFGSKI